MPSLNERLQYVSKHLKRFQDIFCLYFIIAIAIIGNSLFAGFLIYWLVLSIPKTLQVQKELRSEITTDTPISGFYGPGAWLVWLFTTGITHGHMCKALLTAGHLPPEWDYDLIVSSSYTFAASVDLILKSRTIAQLGDEAINSALLPALVCAERAVGVGLGASVVSTVIALSSAEAYGFRQAKIASTPLLAGLIASAFSLRAHNTMTMAGPVVWCAIHDQRESGYIFTLVDFMAWMVIACLAPIPTTYQSMEWWKFVGITSGFTILCTILYTATWRQRGMKSTLRAVALVLAVLLVVLGIGPGLMFALGAVIVVPGLLIMWPLYWGPVYILSFFPQMGYFPVTGISPWEMDQIVALLAAVGVAGLRSWTPVTTALRSRWKRRVTIGEDIPLLAPTGEV